MLPVAVRVAQVKGKSSPTHDKLMSQALLALLL